MHQSCRRAGGYRVIRGKITAAMLQQHMLQQHLACPKCGYDLHGIPAVRCPECGFRYDAAVLRSISASADWVRLIVARSAIVRATIAAGLAVPSVCHTLGATGWLLLLIMFATYAAVFVTWLEMTEAYHGPHSVPTLVRLFVGCGIGLTLLFWRLGPAVSMAGVFFLAAAWLKRLRDWPTLPTPPSAEPTDFRRFVDRHTRACSITLVASSLLVLLALVR